MGTVEQDCSYGEEAWKDREVLYELYHVKGMSQQEVGDVLGCSPMTVSNWMDKHEILIKDARGKGDLTASDTPAGFSHHNDDNGSYEAWMVDDTMVRVHRLLAVAEYGFDAVKDNVVHHKIPIPWLNIPSNVEPLSEEEHSRQHYEEGNALRGINEGVKT